MEKRNFGWVLALMAASTFILVAVQAYWLYRQSQQEREALRRDTQKSLAAVNSDINQRNSFVSQLANEQTYDFRSWSADSLRLFIFASNVSDQIETPDSLLQGKRRAEAEVLAQQWLAEQPAQNGQIFETVLLRSVQQCANCDPDLSLADRYPIDTLLHQALAEQGIHLDFTAGLRNVRTGQWNWFYPSGPVDTLHLGQSDMQLTLLGNEETLYITYPGQNQWIVNQLFFQLLGSLLLVMIIFGSFYSAWRIIARQKKLSEMKTDFINNMTHEFKTPIATIAFAAANIDNEKVLAQPEEVKQFTEIIRRENQRLNHQVEKVLQAAVTDQQAIQLDLKVVDIHSLLQKLVASVELRIQETGGQLAAELNGIYQTEWLTDTLHFSNAINNLLENAIKYAGETPPQVQLKSWVSDEGLQITIQDQGIGIRKEDLAFVFDKFYRAHTGDIHNVKGFGLGLHYVKQVIQMMQGTITVDSNKQGTTFSILLPPLSTPKS